uniref:Uncharacterized protein n=1 Tax=Lactuca sativa TaxID=4236 RepID=A0A9R1W3G0_LACSA|nr:hypothetical protein LSAT_V11C300103910 [Lactuca sativa]
MFDSINWNYLDSVMVQMGFDDVLFVGKWLSSNFDNLARILRCFHACAGLKVNFIYGIGVSTSEVNGCACILGCNAASFSFKYLELICCSKDIDNQSLTGFIPGYLSGKLKLSLLAVDLLWLKLCWVVFRSNFLPV